eukprot:2007081-Rhodomonas_salina.1
MGPFHPKTFTAIQRKYGKLPCTLEDLRDLLATEFAPFMDVSCDAVILAASKRTGGWDIKSAAALCLYCISKETADEITVALRTGFSAHHPNGFRLLQSQPPGHLEVVWKTGTPWGANASASA